MRKSSLRPSSLPSRAPSRPGAAGAPRRRPAADPNAAPFSSYLDRDVARQKRDRNRRRTFIISIGVHVVVLVGVLLYSVLDIDELYSPSVGVKVMRASQLPKGVLPLGPAAPDPALVIPGEKPGR